MRVSAYGRELIILREKDSWRVFESSGEGKRRPAQDIRIPEATEPGEIVQYLGDLLHEHATERHPEVYELEEGDS